MSWRSPAGMRAISLSRKSHLPLKPEEPIEKSPVNTFANETDQQKADLSRSHGYVVIKGDLGHDNAPFLQLSVIQNKQEFFGGLTFTNFDVQWAVLPEVCIGGRTK